MKKIKLAYIKQPFISILGNTRFAKNRKMYRQILATESFFKNLPALLFFIEAGMD